MRFATIGSYLLDDIIQFGIKEGKDYSNVGRYTCISPISLCFPSGFPKETYDSYAMTCSNDYQRRMHHSDMTKSIFREITNKNPDYILFDFTEIFSPVKLFYFEGKKLAFTSQPHLKPSEKQPKEDQEISVFTLSPQGVLNYAKGYVERMISLYGKERLVMVRANAGYQFFDQNGEWKLATDLNDRIKNNTILNRIYDCIENDYQIKTMRLPKLLLNDLSYNVGGAYKFAKVYYELFGTLLAQTVSGEGKGVSEDYVLDKIEELVDEKTMGELASIADENGLQKRKKLVLLGHSESLVRHLRDDFGAEVTITLDYNRNTKDEALSAALKTIENQSEKYYLLIPHLYQNSNAIVECIKKGYFPHVAKIGMNYNQYTIVNMQGEYCDIYNNIAISSAPANIIKFKGRGCSVEINEIAPNAQLSIDCMDQSRTVVGKGVSFVRAIVFLTYWGSRLSIGEYTSFGLDSRIIAFAGGEISIGRDCMFADKAIVQAGDGHAIYDLNTGKNVNSDLNLYQEKNVVRLGDHIWIGREAILINCKIGSGSIVGARALVKKTFPNNCIVAGMPAKIIKKDIGWAREINCYDIDDPRFGVPADYRHFTEEE